MSQPLKPQRILQLERLKISVRFNFILFPIDSIRLIESLKSNGFEILGKMPSPAEVPLKMRVHVGGTVARKGNGLVDIDPDKQILGVAAPSIDETLSVFNELQQVIKHGLEIDIENRARFFELQATYTFDSDQSPIDNLSRFLSQSDLISEASAILDEDVSPFTLRLVSKGRIPNQEEWLDTTFEPSVVRPHRTYLISLVYRSAQRAKVLSFFKGIESKITGMIDLIEKHQ